jgi:hypothetical protein
VIEPPKTIKFSHVYKKFPKEVFGTLIDLRAVDIVPREKMLDSFVEYDTVYDVNGKPRHFPLTAKIYTVLGFDTDLVAPRRIDVTAELSMFASFTTCRSFREWSHSWYAGAVGEGFLVV